MAKSKNYQIWKTTEGNWIVGCEHCKVKLLDSSGNETTEEIKKVYDSPVHFPTNHGGKSWKDL